MSSDELTSATEARDIAARWLDRFEDKLQNREFSDAAGMFQRDSYWRDLLALTWDLRTFHGPGEIAEALALALEARDIRNLRLEGQKVEVYDRSGWGESIEAFVSFETDIAKCRGHLRLRPGPSSKGSDWEAWTLLTSMEDLQGHEERAGHNRPKGPTPHVTDGVPVHWLDDDDLAEPATSGGDPTVLVIGGAQAGLSVAARLRHLGINTLVVEQHERVGDNWRQRYQSLVLHNEVWANHLPYLPFPANFPVYISKDQVADWLERYAQIMDLDVWTSTTFLGGKYDDSRQRWEVQVEGADGVVHHLQPRHVVLATGVFGPRRQLEIPGSDEFGGIVMHAGDYEGGRRADGMDVLIVGSGTSAHDVAQDLYHAGANVTMLQRSSTTVISIEPGAARVYSIYAEDGMATEDADLISNSFPMQLLAELHQGMTERIAEMDKELLEGLEEAGFALDFGEDGSGFLMKFHRYGGGYYINVGCSELIVEGKIDVKQGVEVERLTTDAAVFTDGEHLPVDMVVVAVGYQNMQETVRRIFGDEIAERVGPIWGLDDEGEVRGLWKQTGQPGLWVNGGSLQQVRPYSKYLALQIKGIEEGLLERPLESDTVSQGRSATK